MIEGLMARCARLAVLGLLACGALTWATPASAADCIGREGMEPFCIPDDYASPPSLADRSWNLLFSVLKVQECTKAAIAERQLDRDALVRLTVDRRLAQPMWKAATHLFGHLVPRLDSLNFSDFAGDPDRLLAERALALLDMGASERPNTLVGPSQGIGVQQVFAARALGIDCGIRPALLLDLGMGEGASNYVPQPRNPDGSLAEDAGE